MAIVLGVILLGSAWAWESSDPAARAHFGEVEADIIEAIPEEGLDARSQTASATEQPSDVSDLAAQTDEGDADEDEVVGTDFSDPPPASRDATTSTNIMVSEGGIRMQIGATADAAVDNEQPSGEGSNSDSARMILDPASSRLTFQALLTDNSGNPLPGNDVKIEANIYDGGGGLIEGPIGPAIIPMNNGIVDSSIPASASSFDGTARELGISVNGEPELSPRIKLAAVPYAFRVDRVASEELDDDIELGTATDDGELTLWDGASGVETVRMSGSANRLSTWGDDGNERVRLWGPAFGEVLLFDGSGNNQTVRLSSGPDIIIPGFSSYHEFGGQLSLSNATGEDTIFLGGASATVNTTGGFQLVDSIGSGATVYGDLALASGGAQIDLADELGTRAFLGGASATAGGYLSLYQKDGGVGLELDGDASNNDGGGDIAVYQADGGVGVFLDGDSSGAGFIGVRDAGGSNRIALDGESTGTGGQISVYDDSGTETVEILGDEASGGEGSGQIILRSSTGSDRIEIDADGGSGGRLRLYQDDGASAIIMDGNSPAGANGGGRIRVRNAANVSRVFIDGDYNNTGLGRIRADIVRVQGGVDLAEPFKCKDKATVKPGMVMSIDPTTPGRLMVTTQAYDRKVAGIVSGAGGVQPGITLSQEGVVEGDHLVALTGRVYCWCDASNGVIQPGDMLTTSNTPGHAMIATDFAKAHGAIIGKAMTSLTDGRGLVLVLVQPQ